VAQYRKKPGVIEATQWRKNGDHPADDCETFVAPATGEPFQGEGHVVRYYRDPWVSGQKFCQLCQHRMHDHGWIDTPKSGHIVCPGDWVITSEKGTRYPCKPDIFEETYELE
jgi:hypothetical protein